MVTGDEVGGGWGRLRGEGALPGGGGHCPGTLHWQHRDALHVQRGSLPPLTERGYKGIAWKGHSRCNPLKPLYSLNTAGEV